MARMFRSQIFIVWSHEAVRTVALSIHKHDETASRCPSKVSCGVLTFASSDRDFLLEPCCESSNVVADQIFRRLSQLPDASCRPFGDTAMHSTALSCPLHVKMQVAVFEFMFHSQIMIVWSFEPLANTAVPVSSFMAIHPTPLIGASCPVIVSLCSPFMFQMLTVLS